MSVWLLQIHSRSTNARKLQEAMTRSEAGAGEQRIKDAASIKMRLEEEIVSLITETQGTTSPSLLQIRCIR
jgi:hypothetical protein